MERDWGQGQVPSGRSSSDGGASSHGGNCSNGKQDGSRTGSQQIGWSAASGISPQPGVSKLVGQPPPQQRQPTVKTIVTTATPVTAEAQTM